MLFRTCVSLAVLFVSACGSKEDLPVSYEGLPVSYEDLWWIDYTNFQDVTLKDRVEALDNGFYLAPNSEKRAPWPATPPLDWGANPFRDSDWRYQLNAWRIIEPYLQAYEQSHDPILIEKSLPYIRDWYVFNLTNKGINRYKWYDAATALRAMKLAYILMIDRRDHVLSKDDLEFVERLADLHTEILTDPENIVPNNHAFFQLHGAMTLCRTRPESTGCNGSGEQVKTLFAKAIRQQYGSEAMHMEHSPGYHFFVYKLIRGFLDTGWYDGIADLDDIEHRIIANAAWLIDPNGALIEVGDTSPHQRNIGQKPLPSAPDRCATQSRYDPDCYGVRLFAEAGYATARSMPPTPPEKSSLLFMSGGYHSKSHRHGDDLAFVWMEGGQWILSDTGKFSYGGGPKRIYSRSTQAHNSVAANGKSASIKPKFAYGSAIRSAQARSWGFELFGSVWHRDNKFHHARRILYRPGEWVIIIDRLKNKYESNRRFTAWFHLAIGSGAALSDAGATIILPDGKPLSLAQGSDFSDCTHRIAEGETDPLQGWRVVNYRHMTPRPALAFSCSGQAGTMVHVFTLDQQPASINHGEDGFHIRIGDRWSAAVSDTVKVRETN